MQIFMFYVIIGLAFYWGPGFSDEPALNKVSDEVWLIYFAVGLVLLVHNMSANFRHLIKLYRPRPRHRMAYRLLYGFAAALVGAALPGLFGLDLGLSPGVPQAVGALSLFAIIYFLNPTGALFRKRPKDEDVAAILERHLEDEKDQEVWKWTQAVGDLKYLLPEEDIEAALTALEAGDQSPTRALFERIAADPEIEPEKAAEAECQLAVMAESEGDQEAALVHLQSACRLEPKDSSNLGLAGDMAMQLGQYALALQHFEKALELDTEAFGPEYIVLGDDWSRLAGARVGLGEHETALECLEKAMAIKSRVFGKDHKLVSYCLCDIAAVLSELGRHGEAIEHYQKALDIRIEAFGPDSWWAAEGWDNLGRECLALGQHQEAVGHFEKALDIYNWQPISDDPDAVVCAKNLEAAKEALAGADTSV